VLVKKAMKAMKQPACAGWSSPAGRRQPPVAVDARRRGKTPALRVHYPELEFCTDNGAMIALAGALRLAAGSPVKPAGAFAVQPRWPLEFAVRSC
jgi:N6-L-threonylcarbamoyladenine synthase